jgi:pantoate--beta-alanine ligase
MITVDTVAALKTEMARLRQRARRVAFVPTMGNLHAGHRALMEQAQRQADAVVASIYVNPLQFGPREDFATYPRTPENDQALLDAAGVALLFTPSDAEMYPRGGERQTQIEVPGLGDILDGALRPGHFRGVTTVVNRLFNLVGPDVALFGKKDYQQWVVLRQMVADLGMPVEIVGVETVRDADGLALSSRNNYLSAEERRIAPELFRTLEAVCQEIESRRVIPPDIEARALDRLQKASFVPDYISIRRRDLAPPGPQDGELVVLGAARLGVTRLIDNQELDLNPAA